jgi:hypothetical protein
MTNFNLSKSINEASHESFHAVIIGGILG